MNQLLVEEDVESNTDLFASGRCWSKYFGSVFIWYGSGRIRILHFRLKTDPDTEPIRIQGFDDQKLKKIYGWKKNVFFDQKRQFTYP